MDNEWFPDHVRARNFWSRALYACRFTSWLTVIFLAFGLVLGADNGNVIEFGLLFYFFGLLVGISGSLCLQYDIQQQELWIKENRADAARPRGDVEEDMRHERSETLWYIPLLIGQLRVLRDVGHMLFVVLGLISLLRLLLPTLHLSRQPEFGKRMLRPSSEP